MHLTDFIQSHLTVLSQDVCISVKWSSTDIYTKKLLEEWTTKSILAWDWLLTSCICSPWVLVANIIMQQTILVATVAQGDQERWI